MTSRWDSSDPDRAPPPLPLNPGSSSPVTKPNTSKNVAAAAEAFAAKARDSNYTINQSPPKSPEKSLIKGQHHKRLQSLQNGALKERNSYTDALSSLDRSPEKSPERSAERFSHASGLDRENRSPEKSPTRSDTSTPGGKDAERDAPSLSRSRPSLRPILGENTPPSSTMLALQNMVKPKDPDSSLADITNKSTPQIRNPQTFDGLSSQILSLTNIATNLQREMAHLSRRSKDNATDLVSLKEATNSRDEDIRKSLRELLTNVSEKMLEPQVDHGARATSNYNRSPGHLLLDNKAYNSPSAMPRAVPMSRVGSPSSFGGSDPPSNAYNMEGAASIALLEKIWRDMGTKEGQEQLIATLSEIQNQRTTKQSDPVVTRKLEEVLNLLKDSTESRALVPRRDNGNRIVSNGRRVPSSAPKLELDFNPMPAPLSRASRELTPSREGPKPLIPKAADFVNDDMQKMLKRMKDSITESGGMTAEVKAHVRELRGEVLGMGRDIARRLEQAESSNQANRGDSQGPGREEIAHIVQEGLAELREHMEILTRDRRRQSSSSMTSRHSVDGQEVYAAVKNALTEFPLKQQVALKEPGSGMEREDILEAVREAWETYKPEIEIQNLGLERDEILQTLKEGIQQYRPEDQGRDLGGATYNEVLDAVREGLENFKPPASIETESSITREEILMAVRECLDSYEFPASAVGAPKEMEITRDDVIDAVKEGLSNQAPISKEIEFNRDDLFDAVKAGLEGAPTPMGGFGEKVMEKMEELIDDMRVEFKQYSVANGGDTEQVLDAMKDGLEVLRADIESYVDRAADVTGKDEIIDTIRHSIEHLRIDLEGSIASSARTPEQTNSVQLLDAMEKEFEHLRQTIATSMVRSGGTGLEREEILDIIREGFEGTRGELPLSRGVNMETDGNTIDIMRDEFAHLRETLATTVLSSSGSAHKEEILEAIREGHENFRTEMGGRLERPESIISGTGELLDALNDGLDGLRADVEKMVNRPLDMTVNYEILETLKEGLANVRAEMNLLRTSQFGQRGFTGTRDGEVVIANGEAPETHRSDTSNLEMMITQLRIKVEALDNMPPPVASTAAGDVIAKEHMDGLNTRLKDVQASIAEIFQRETDRDDSVAMKEDIEAVETLLRNTKAKVDDLGSSQSEGLARVAHMESIESILNETRDAVNDLGVDGASRKDIGVLEALLKEVRAGLEELREKGPGQDDGERITKTDIEALETLCMDTKAQIDELNIPEPETLATKEEMITVAELIRTFNEQVSEDQDMKAQAFEARKTEHGGIADKVEDVKLILEDVREELKAKIDEGHQSVNDVIATLEVMAENITAADATATVSELQDSLKTEFESVRRSHDNAKEYHEQNHSILLGKHVEYKNAIIDDLNAKLDARFDEIMTKYDDAQLAAREKECVLGCKDAENSEALTATKTVAEDLRLLIDTLGAMVTESCDRMSEDSKTVFNRVEEITLKLDELLAADGKAEHRATRAEISNILVGVEGVQAHATEYQPKILEAVKDVLSIVGQHYEQAKTSSEELKTNIQAIPGSIPLPAITPTTMPALEMLRDIPAPEKYDDTAVHAKLDELMSYATDAGKSVAEVAMLEHIREQVSSTSAQLNGFVLAQKAAITESSNTKAREAEEAAIALEKRTAQKENVEMDIVKLSGEREALNIDVRNLLKEKDELAALKSKIQADLSSLETALDIRREELHVMEARAEGLERRILDGVLDHSRSLLTTSRPQSSLKEMNLKRVTSTSSNATTSTRASTILPSSHASAVSSGVGMAMKRRPPPRVSATNLTTSRDRRILSLSTLSANKGVINDRSMVLARPSIASGTPQASTVGVGGLKRSHSVKSNFPVRKTSWNGTKYLGAHADEGHDVEDKENSILDEADEEDGEGSQADTERRTSYSGTYTGTGSYGEGSVISSRDDDKRVSYDASTVGTIGTKDFAITEDGHSDEEEGQEVEQGQEERPEEPSHDAEEKIEGQMGDGLYIAKEAYQMGDPRKDMVVFGHNSDSGIGTDIPTAQLDAGGSDYFKKE